MANNDSTIVANLEATPNVMADASELGGKQRALVATYEVLAADSDGDTYTMFPVSLDARVDDLQVVNDAITGGTDYDVGFYSITDNDLGAVISTGDNLVDGQSMATARNVWTSLLFLGTNAMDQSAVAQKVWQICGYASLDAARDANQTNQVYLVVTANTVGTATGTLSVKLQVTVE